MRTPQSTNDPPASANMTPMIDVVFLLIIFFLVSSHLARQENHLPVDLPIATTFSPFDPDKAALTITVDEQARMRIGGNVVDLSRLRSALTELSGGARTAAIRVRVDGQVRYASVEPILREAALMGVTDVAIAVREET